jgi:hypothetical protein
MELRMKLIRPLREWRLKRTLKRAERLRSKGILTDPEYYAVTVDVVMRLAHPERPTLRNRHLRSAPINWDEFYGDSHEVLHGFATASGSVVIRNSAYGNYAFAPAKLRDELQGQEATLEGSRGFDWTDEADTLLREARFRLSVVHRAAMPVEDWLGERWARFPRILAIVGALLGFAAGVLAGRWSKAAEPATTTEANRHAVTVKAAGQ